MAPSRHFTVWRPSLLEHERSIAAAASGVPGVTGVRFAPADSYPHVPRDAASEDTCMKPSDRSLDIVAIGLGQAGGNLAAEFARRGYRAVALNTARTDLSALSAKHAAFAEMQRLYIGIDGYDGAGSNLEYGRDCVMASADRIRQFVAHHTEGADIVMLTAGFGGGTGSAMSELVRVLASVELPTITLATLPGEQESAIAKVNAVRAVSDLVKVPDLTLILVDNARLAEQHAHAALDEYFQRINSIIIEPLDALNRLNRRPGLRPIRSLDGENLRTLLTSSGVLNYAERQCSGLSVDDVTEWVTSALPSSGVMPTGSAMSDVTYLGFVVEASRDLLANTPFTLFNELSERLKSSTSNAVMYLGVYRNDQMASNQATLRLLASSTSLPTAIRAIVHAAQREGGLLSEKLSRSRDDLDLGDIVDFDLLPHRSAAARALGLTRRRRPTPGHPKQRADERRSRPDAAGREMAGSLLPPESVELESMVGTAPSERDTFDQLVAAFLGTESEPIRRGIAARLQSSRDSDRPLARFYANRAIERLVDAGQERALDSVRRPI